MFCCKCGTQNPDDANYCHDCGSSLYREAAKHSSDQSTRDEVSRQVETPQDEEQRRLIDELLPIDQRTKECHACGRRNNLHGWDFGLGKKSSSARAWGGTALSIAISAVTIPLIGAGGLQLPGKSTRYQVLRLRLVLCDSCWDGKVKYDLHPWWQKATQLGYTEFFDAKGLKKLKPKRK
jgi:ribosomal protein L40E